MLYCGPNGTSPAAVVRDTESPTKSTLIGGPAWAGGLAGGAAVSVAGAGVGAVIGGNAGAAWTGSSVGLGTVLAVRSCVRAATDRVVKTDASVTKPRTAITLDAVTRNWGRASRRSPCTLRTSARIGAWPAVTALLGPRLPTSPPRQVP